jgi:hypothetical protein
MQFSEKIESQGSEWYALVAEADEASPAPANVFSQAVTNCIRVYAGRAKIRNEQSATYFLNWIDKLRGMTEDLKLWRTAEEREHVFAQFEQASAVYRARREEANRRE